MKYLIQPRNCLEMHDILWQATEKYEELFLIDYPFEKLDTVFVPEFNWGAMENSGCVTYHESYIFKDDVISE
jgi:aminopeptidase N